jgi:hypothetical protein
MLPAQANICLEEIQIQGRPLQPALGTDPESSRVAFHISSWDSTRSSDSASDVDSDADSQCEDGIQREEDTVVEDFVAYTIRRSSGGVSLYFIYGICSVMAIVSVLLIYEFEEYQSVQRDFDERSSIVDTLPLFSSKEGLCVTGDQHPLWFTILKQQIRTLQNLIHASLLGAAATVAAVRGDVLWALFTRNVAFYFGLAALSYAVVDWHVLTSPSESPRNQIGLRLLLASILFICCLVAFGSRVVTFYRLRSLLSSHAWASNVETAFLREPSGLAGSASDRSKVVAISFGCVAIQLLAIFYTSVTTLEYLSHLKTRDAADGVETEHKHAAFRSFEMSYSLGAHEAFLLSLIMLISVLPRDPASIGGAILASGWRTLVSVASVVNILWSWEGSDRDRWSLLCTFFEAAIMSPILFIVLQLLREYLSDNALTFQVEYSRLQDDDCEPGRISNKNDRVLNTSGHIASTGRFACPTLAQIASSERYSRLQRLGARTVWIGCVGLLAGMMLECFAMLRETFVGASDTRDIYNWGIHMASMYLFVAAMSVGSPFFYHYARRLLIVMCPVGALFGAWQLSIFLRFSNGLDCWGLFVGGLLAVRIICGLVQTVGLVALQSTEQVRVRPERGDQRDGGRIHIAIAHASVAFYRVYLPVFATFLVLEVLKGDCLAVMISPSTYSHGDNADLLYARNWPSLGLFFHFGMMVVIFAGDSLSVGVPNYKPSLAIAWLFSAVTGTLIFLSLAWDWRQTDGWSTIGLVDIVMRLSLAAFMMASGHLSWCLGRLWNARILCL